MNLLTRLTSILQPVNVSTEPPPLYFLKNGRLTAVKIGATDGYDYRVYTSAAMPVIPQNDEGYAAAYTQSVYASRCVDILSSDVASVKHTVVDLQTGKPSPTHPLMIAFSWAKRQYSQNLLRLWVKDLRIFGEAYIEPTKDVFERYVGARRLNPLAIEPFIDGTRILYFQYLPPGGGVRNTNFKPNELIFDRYENLFSDLRGYSKFAVILSEITTDRDLQRYIRAWFENDATPGGILSARQGTSITDNQLKALINQIKEQTKGVRNKHRPIALGEAVEWQQVQASFETSHLQVEESIRRRICMALDIPMSTAGAWDDARYQSAPEQRKAYYEGTVIPECTRLAESINELMMPFYDRSGRFEFRFDFTDIKALSEDIKAKTDLVNAQVGGSLLQVNEGRRALNLEPVAGGDVFLVPSGLVAVSDFSKMTPPVVSPPPVASPAAPIAAALPPPAPQLPAEAGMKACALMLHMPNHPDLMSLQKAVHEHCKDIPVDWTTPEDFHVTLLSIPACSDSQLAALINRLNDLDVPELELRVGSLRVFDTGANYAIHFRIRNNEDLNDLQGAAYDLCNELGIQTSAYSIPEQYTPHITMGYAQQKPSARTFTGKLTVKPSEMRLMSDQKTLHKQMLTPVAPPAKAQPPQSDAAGELEAWRKKAANGGAAKARAFVSYTLPDGLSKWVTHQLSDDLDKPALKALFDEAQTWLEDNLKWTDDRLNTVYAALRCLKAYANTYDAFTKEMLRIIGAAQADETTRKLFAGNMRSVLRQYGLMAFRDGMNEAGYDPESFSSDELKAFRQWQDEQSGYVTGLGAEIFKVGITENEVEIRARMWADISLNAIRYVGVALGNSDKRYKRVLHPAEHCPDCLALEGQVHTMKEWLDKGALPGSHFTQCGPGCKCTLEPTSDPIKGDFLG